MKLKNLVWVVLAIVLLVAAIRIIVGRQGQDEPASSGPQKKPTLVQVQPARVNPIASTLELTGEVVASNSAVISTMKEGRIEYCPWREGDTVKAGETLVLIDREVHRTEHQAAQAALGLAQAKHDDLLAGTRPEAIRSAEAFLRRSQASLTEAQQSYDRQSALFAQDVVSQDALDKAREQKAIAEAEVSSAKDNLAMLEAGSTATAETVSSAGVTEAAARRDLAQAHLDECEIVAPFSGIVSKIHVRPGDIAMLREPLVEIFDPSSLVVRFEVPEAQANSVHTGMPLEINLDAAPNQVLSAKVSRVYPELDPVMRTRTIEVVLTESIDLVPYMFARLKLNLAEAKDALTVPAEAVLVSPNGKRKLFVVEEGVAVERQVHTGIEDGVRIQILSGVKAGEKVAVAGNERLKPGMKVRVAKEKGAAQEGMGKAGGAKKGDKGEAAQTEETGDEAGGKSPGNSANKSDGKSSGEAESSESKKGSQL